jgi:hypothetical protein
MILNKEIKIIYLMSKSIKTFSYTSDFLYNFIVNSELVWVAQNVFLNAF